MTYPGWEIWVKCSTRSSPWPGSGCGEWTSHARLVMTGSMLPVACGPLHCLFGEWCSAVKCWPSWQQFHCPFGLMAGACLAHTSQADWHPGGCGGRGGGGGGLTEERSCWLSTLVLGQACCQLERRLPCSHHDLHVSVATGILVCTSRVNIIPSWSVSTTMLTEHLWKLFSFFFHSLPFLSAFGSQHFCLHSNTSQDLRQLTIFVFILLFFVVFQSSPHSAI